MNINARITEISRDLKSGLKLINVHLKYVYLNNTLNRFHVPFLVFYRIHVPVCCVIPIFH